MTPKNKSRLTLLLIAVLFFGSFGIALVLHYSNWQPSQTRNHGEFVKPPIALGGLSLRTLDGQDYPWQPGEGIWRVLVAPPSDCVRPCLDLLEALYRVWFSEGRHADALDVLWVGELPRGGAQFRRLVAIEPDAGLLAALPDRAGVDALPVYVLDPSGYLVLRFAPGFDPSGLSKDLYRLIK